MALVSGQYEENVKRYKLCEKCGKLILIHQACDCYDELSKPAIRNEVVSISVKV